MLEPACAAVLLSTLVRRPQPGHRRARTRDAGMALRDKRFAPRLIQFWFPAGDIRVGAKPCAALPASERIDEVLRSEAGRFGTQTLGDLCGECGWPAVSFAAIVWRASDPRNVSTDWPATSCSSGQLAPRSPKPAGAAPQADWFAQPIQSALRPYPATRWWAPGKSHSDFLPIRRELPSL